ncbi:MAG: RimK family alpha-L-glutamate ligase [Clostridia bacterium]|nr:RimK family alpha-L-glutamate ligase [Clostridia bacterium]
MKGVIVRNAYYTTLSPRYQTVRLREAGEARGLEMSVYENKHPYFSDELPQEFADADVVFFFDKDVKLAYDLENARKVLLNPARSIEIADDKATTAVYLARYGLPHPKTIPSPKRFDKGTDPTYLAEVGAVLTYPLVVKQNGGSLGQQVYLAHDYEELLTIDREISEFDRLYQEYRKESEGESYRVLVIGGKTFCAMKLKSDSDFRSNAAMGGNAEKADLPEEFRALAEDTAKKFALNYVGVDLFCHKPEVIELNSNAYFRMAESVTGLDVAGAIVEEAMDLFRQKNTI